MFLEGAILEGLLMADLWQCVRALLLLIVANSVPWLLGRLLRDRWAWPLDLGLMARDGQRLLGDHKTWRGLIGSAFAAGLAGVWLDVGFTLGALVAALSLLGDALSSAFKRRLRLSPGADAPFVDQVPEALLPLSVLARPLDLGVVEVVLTTLAFVVLGLLATRVQTPG